MGALSHSVVVAACLAAGCGAQSGFQCVDDTQCGPAGGTCQADGWCSFPDDVCASGQRYGEHAGDGLGGACVTTPAASSGPDTAGPTSGVTSGTGLDTQGGSTASVSVGGETTRGVDATDSTGAAAGSSGGETTGAPIDPSLIAWYTFDDLAAPYLDVSGHGHDAWCGGEDCPEAAIGVDGAGLSFDGLDDHLHVDHTAALAPADELTVAVWFNLAAPTPAWRTVMAQPVGMGTANSWEIGLEAGLLYAGAGDELQQSGGVVPFDDLGTWHHVALTWVAGGEVQLYLDGALAAASPAVDIAYDRRGLLLGADVDDQADDNFFPGALDDARIYARALDDAEIASLATRP